MPSPSPVVSEQPTTDVISETEETSVPHLHLPVGVGTEGIFDAHRALNNPTDSHSLLGEDGSLSVSSHRVEGSSGSEATGHALEVHPSLSEVLDPSVPPTQARAGRALKPVELKVVFWNTNTWNAQNCEKLVETVVSSAADVVCIVDARLDNYKARYIGGLL